MEIERQHHRTTSELYICFTSRLSHSSSMRRSSKSILSPGRNFNGDNNHNSSTPLTTSLSRRLRKNGSLRGGAQSPALFPSNVKKNRGSSVFSENPEPSSPKVTCIGQVRVKTKKQGKKIKLRANFRRVEEKKGFGSEFSCFLPCKSSCFSSSSNERKGEKGCFRWLVSLQEGEEGKRRDIELVVGGEEDEVIEEKGRVIERGCSRRRSIFDDMEFDDLFANNNNYVKSVDDNVNGNDSVCVPPNNALLLMRCRSNPKRMASLSQKFLEVSFVEQLDDVGDVSVVEVKEGSFVQVKEEICVLDDEILEVRLEEIVEIEEEKREEIVENVKLDEVEDEIDEICEDLKLVEDKIDEICEDLVVIEPKIEDLLVGFSEELEQNLEEVEEEKHGVEELEQNLEQVLPSVEEIQLMESEIFGEKVEESENGCLIEAITVEEKVEEAENAKNLVDMLEEQAMEVQDEKKIEELDPKQETIEVEKDLVEEEKQGGRKSMEKEKTKTMPSLPDCLLLMMCEPKLSVEVSKETWMSSTDFIRCLPERHHNQKPNKPENSDDLSNITNKNAKPAAILPLCQLTKPGIQPSRSSISFPASAGSVANMIEQKLAKAGVSVGYEPFVLPRCKSAPLRSTAKFGCKFEPHRSATCGVGTAGIGF